jgi:phosphoserine phosphatase
LVLVETFMFVATLVAPAATPVVDAALVGQAARALKGAGAHISHDALLKDGIAADLHFDGLLPPDARRALLLALAGQPVDVFVQVRAHRRRKMLIADMDSTIIQCECIDELADFVGKKAEVAAVTEAAMRGELDFVEALDARVSLLKGLPEATLQRCYDERVRLTPGAHALIQTLAADGVHTVLVSGGFTFFTSRVAAATGFALNIANTLEIAGSALTGTVARPIVTAAVKRETLFAQAAAQGLDAAQVLAVGDGANDIPMIQAAGLGIAFHAKPKTEAAATASVRHGDLSALLWAMGYAG